jgi:Lamin Tail Domain
MNNKKIISGAVWVVGLLVVGIGGYWYFSGGAGLGGDVAWSNGVALVESSWDEAVGLPGATTTSATATVASGNDNVNGGSDDDDSAPATGATTGAAAKSVSATPAPAGPAPVYSIADAGSAATGSDNGVSGATGTTEATPTDADTTAATPTTETAPTTTNAQATSATMAAAPAQTSSMPAPVVTYSAPSSSAAAVASTTVATTQPTETTTTQVAATSTDVSTTSSETDTTTTSTAQTTPVETASIDQLVIVQVQIAGAASSNDFVKIFNPTNAPVDLTGWKLHKKSSTGADYSLKTFPSGLTIASGGYITWANSENGFADSISADVSSTETLSADNSVALMDPSETVIDAVAWGTGTNQYVEGDAYPTDPTANQVLIRKSSNGAVVDTDDNANDFTLQ